MKLKQLIENTNPHLKYNLSYFADANEVLEKFKSVVASQNIAGVDVSDIKKKESTHSTSITYKSVEIVISTTAGWEEKTIGDILKDFKEKLKKN